MLPARRPYSVFCILAICVSVVASAQPPIFEVIIDGRSEAQFGGVLGIRQLRDGHMLVNDAVRRQLVDLDRGLTRFRVVLDSAGTGDRGYGPTGSPIISYLADTTLFVDGSSKSLLVIDPRGNVIRAIAPPTLRDLPLLASSASATDRDGNLIYRIPKIDVQGIGRPDASLGAIRKLADSGTLVRATFERRQVDTIVRVKQESSSQMVMRRNSQSQISLKFFLNPLEVSDDWAVLSDGTVAVVRGHDYHIDLFPRNGSRLSGPKLPFATHRLSDADKQTLIDSAENDLKHSAFGASRSSASNAAMMNVFTAVRKLNKGLANLLPQPIPKSIDFKINGVTSNVVPEISFVSIAEIPDYYPAAHAESAIADLDNQLWILPIRSTASKNGELVYDVASNRGELVKRVRMPIGRSIAGFGHEGILYLMSRNENGNWIVERARVEVKARQ